MNVTMGILSMETVVILHVTLNLVGIVFILILLIATKHLDQL